MAFGVALCSPAFADDDGGGCSIPAAIVTKIQTQLAIVVNLPDANGGIFKPGNYSCGQLWWTGRAGSAPSSRLAMRGPAAAPSQLPRPTQPMISAMSNLALSTANLYAPTQPGGSLYSLNNSNPFNPEFLAPGSGANQFAGGIITFGGGVALYQGGQVIGGLGVSGDSSCADHAIAYRMRKLAKLDAIPAGVDPSNTDNISYPPVTTPPTAPTASSSRIVSRRISPRKPVRLRTATLARQGCVVRRCNLAWTASVRTALIETWRPFSRTGANLKFAADPAS